MGKIKIFLSPSSLGNGNASEMFIQMFSVGIKIIYNKI